MNLELFTNSICSKPCLLKEEIRPGDQIMVKTRNSVYRLVAKDGHNFFVSGGWFGSEQSNPVETTVAGCSMGGSFLKYDAIAVCGFRLEFGNRVITSAITSFVLIKRYQLN